MLDSDKVPSGSRKTGTVTGRKAGWLGNGTGVGYNVMRLLLGKRPFLSVRPEEVEGGINGVDIVAIIVWLDEVGLDEQRYPWRYWGNCHPRMYWGNCHPRRYWGNCRPRRYWGGCHPRRSRWNRQDCRLWENANGECRIRDGAIEYSGEVKNGLLLVVAVLGKQGDRVCIGEGLHEGTRCNSGYVDGGGFWHRTLVRENCTVLAVRLALIFGT